MAYAFVQQTAAAVAGGSGITTTSTPVWGTNLTAGNALVWVYIYAAATVKTVTISQIGQAATFVSVGSVFAGGSGMIWGYAKNITGGINAIVTSVSSANVTFPGLAVAEYSGLDTTAPFTAGEFKGQDQATPTTGANSVTSTATPTLAVQPAAVIGFSCDYVNNTAPTAGTGYTTRAAVWNFGGSGTAARFEDKRVTATTAVSATFTAAANEEHLTCVIVLAEASAGGGGAMAGTTSITFGSTSGLTGGGALVGSGAVTFGSTSALTGSGALVGTTLLQFGQTGIATGIGALLGTATLVFGSTSSLVGTGALAGTSALLFGSSSSLAGVGSLSGTATLVFGQSGTLTLPSGAMAGTAGLSFGSLAQLNGTGALSGSGSLVFGVQSTLTGLAQLAGSGAIVFGQQGNLTNLIVGGNPMRVWIGRGSTKGPGMRVYIS